MDRRPSLNGYRKHGNDTHTPRSKISARIASQKEFTDEISWSVRVRLGVVLTALAAGMMAIQSTETSTAEKKPRENKDLPIKAPHEKTGK